MATQPESGAEPKTLCRFWRKGCNGAAQPDGDNLGLCDDCQREENSRNRIRAGFRTAGVTL